MGDNLPSNRTLPPVGLWRWNQYLTPPQWVPFTGGVSEKGVAQVQITNGTYDADVTKNGQLFVSNSNLQIAMGKFSDTSIIHKFGNAPDFDLGDGEVSIWDGAEDDTTWEKMVYNYSTSADIVSLSSDNTNDKQIYEIQGLDTNYDLVIQNVTANGLVRVLVPTALRRVFRIKNLGATNNAGHIFVFSGTAVGGTVAGVPSVVAGIRAMIQPGNNQTLMAIYTIPNGKTGYLSDFYMSSAGASKSIAYIVKVWARPFGGVFQLKHHTSVNDTGSSYMIHDYKVPAKYDAKTDIAMTVECGGTATAASFSAGFDIILVDN